METDQARRTIFKREPEIVSRRIAGETILVPIRGKLADMRQIYVLNPVAEYIWERLDGNTSLDEICAGILARFDVKQAQAEADLQEFMAELIEAELVEGMV